MLFWKPSTWHNWLWETCLPWDAWLGCSALAFSFSQPWMWVATPLKQVTQKYNKGVSSVCHTSAQPMSSRHLSGGVTNNGHWDILPRLFPSFPRDKEISWLVIGAGSLELIFTNELMCRHHRSLLPCGLLSFSSFQDQGWRGLSPCDSEARWKWMRNRIYQSPKVHN